MKRVEVDSSNIVAVTYKPNRMVLVVEFTSGQTYEYRGVPQSLYEALLNASSCEQYLNSVIRPWYEYRLVGEW